MWKLRNKAKLNQVIFLVTCIGALLLSGPGYSLESGWYTNSPNTQARNNLGVYASQGASIMLPYNCYNDRAGTEAYLNEAAARKMKIWIDLRLHAFGGSPPSESNWKSFINAFKGHTAVKGWYIADEPEYSGPSYSVIQQYYNWTRQADPSHPVALAHAWTVRSESAGVAQDILLDVYPQWGYGSTDYNEFCSRVRESYKWWRNAKNVTDGRGQSIWAVPLGFGYSPGTTSPQNAVRDLTDAEHKWHTHTATVLGYKGAIFWWDMNSQGMVQTNPNMKALVAKRFSEISQMASEMANGTTNSGLASVSAPTTKLIYRYGTTPSTDTGVILAVNISRYDASDNNGETLTSVAFTLPSGIQTSQVEVINENRVIPVTNGVFTDRFNRFEVHAYKFRTSSTTGVPSAPTNLRIVEN
jgi:hypothetical protein